MNDLEKSGNMIAEITAGGNSPKFVDRHYQGNSHAVDFRMQ
jgi:hypothetical protein